MVALLAMLALARTAEARQAERVVDPARPAAATTALPFVIEGPAAPTGPEVIARDTEGRTTIRATRLAGPLRIDGALDDDLYSTVPAIADFVQVEPREGAAATDKTEAWLAFDHAHVYFAFRCWETDPSRRVATEMRRDSPGLWNGNDVVAIFLDTFYDRRNGLVITINALGGRNDGQVTNERQYSGDWNPIYEFAVGRFEGGWSLEVAVPFKSLRYRPGQAQAWGFNVLRTSRWKNELSLLRRIPAGRGMQSVMQASLAATVVGIEAPAGGRNLEIKPYAISELTTNAAATPPVSNALSANAGLDVKYGLTENLTADFTYNTDFAQVEADEQQVNLTRFSLFFPEKREFFLENQGTFSFGGVPTTGMQAGTTEAPVLFYSRRIGLDRGLAVPIEAGGRVTGRAGRYSIGVLNIQTGRADASGSPPTNFSVVRLKRDLLRRSSVGLLATARSDMPGGPGLNLAYGLDGTFGFFNDLAINTYWARTRTEGLDGDDTSHRVQLDYAGDRYGVQVEHLAVGDHFNPEVGFLRRDDMRRTFGQLRFSPRLVQHQSIRKLSWMGSLAYVENGAGHLETRQQSGEFAVEFQNSDRFNLTYTANYEVLPRPFPIARDVTLPVGAYRFDILQAGFSLGQHRTLSGNLVAEVGSFYDGRKTSVSFSRGRLNVTPAFSMEPSYSVNWVDVLAGAFTSHLVGSRLTYTRTPLMFVSALVQYSSASNTVAANVRLRWEYRPGSEVFVVYNEERDTGVSGFPVTANRSFIIKINRLFRL
ncbi:MAG: DUF5916 domain-containing protein [Acidobacteriota bacterium]